MIKHMIIYLNLLFVLSCSAISQTQVNITQTPMSTTLPSDVITKTNSISTELQIKFEGSVVQGQLFEYSISDTVFFQLRPIEYGWKIWLGDKKEPVHDFISVATPPFHGMNPRFIEGWHFRKSDNSGPNGPGPKLVNAPQKERRFYFVLKETDYQVAYTFLNEQLLSSDDEREQIREKWEQLEPREGILTITNLELGNLELGERARIEYMEFEVELSLPSDF